MREAVEVRLNQLVKFHNAKTLVESGKVKDNPQTRWSAPEGTALKTRLARTRFFTYASWEQAFRQIARLAKDQRLALFLFETRHRDL